MNGGFGMRTLAAAVAAAALLGGCASNPATGGSDFILMSEEEELQLGRQYHRFVLSQYKVYDDQALQDYVTSIGNALAKNSHRAELEYHFTVLDDEQVNAFATPGGYIYVSRGLLTYLNSEAELAAVLGHEIGHVTARHAARQHGTKTLTGMLGTLAAIGTGTPLAGTATGFLGQAFNSGYGRQMELEADRLGAEYAAKTGYNHRAMLDVIGQLKNQEQFEIKAAAEEARQPRVYHGIFASHPDKDTRLREAVDAAAATAAATDPYDGRYEYLSMIDGVPYGVNRSFRDVLVRGHTVYHHGLGVAITFPRGWRIDNQARRLVAQSRYGNALIMLTTERIDPRIPPEDYFERRLGVSDARDGEALRGGYPGYTAIVPRAATPFGAQDARFAVVYMGDRAYLFVSAVDGREDPKTFDPEIFTAVNSLRYISEDEKDKARQPTLRLVQVDAGMTIDKLAAESSLPKYAEDQLRLINGLYPDKEPTTGDLIKFVE